MMFDLPEGWSLTTIGSVCDIRTGKTPPTANQNNFSGDVPFFKPGDLDRKDVLEASEYSISHIGAEVAGTPTEGYRLSILHRKPR